MEVAVRASLSVHGTDEDIFKTSKEVASELLAVIEDKIGSPQFIGHFGVIQRKIEGSKAEKKRRLAAEAITDPQLYANRRIELAKKKKELHKKKIAKLQAVKGKRKKSSKTAILYEEA